MRRMEFKMERTGLLDVGDVLPVTEYKLPNSWYYVLGSSFAMSANYPTSERLACASGTVLEVKETPKGYYVIVEFDEPDPAARGGEEISAAPKPEGGRV